MLAIFEVRSGWVERIGSLAETVVAPDLGAALQAAADTDPWVWEDAREVTVKRVASAYCDHQCATGNGSEYTPERPLTAWECEDCRETWGVNADHPEPTASARAFALYCERLLAMGTHDYRED